jgi:predicted nucleic acid-binding protein
VILLDATILVYAVGSQHPLRDPCRQLMEWAVDGTIRATTTSETVQEFTHIRALHRSRADAVAIAKDYALSLSPLVSPDIDDLVAGLEVFSRVTSLGAFDSVLAATGRRHGWPLASADKGFGRVSGLTHLNPASPSFLESVRAAG